MPACCAFRSTPITCLSRLMRFWELSKNCAKSSRCPGWKARQIGQPKRSPSILNETKNTARVRENSLTLAFFLGVLAVQTSSGGRRRLGREFGLQQIEHAADGRELFQLLVSQPDAEV